MNECWICNKIYDTKELFEMNSWDREVCCITYNKNDDTYNIWSECDDDYYSGEILEINFCPICGRKINLNYKANRQPKFSFYRQIRKVDREYVHRKYSYR